VPAVLNHHTGWKQSEILTMNDIRIYDAARDERLVELDRAIESKNDLIATFREVVKSCSQTAHDLFHSNVPASDLVKGYTFFIDELLLRAWRYHFDNDVHHVALLAVGGYGRGELHPASDIDLLILLGKKVTTEHKDSIQRFLTFLWDIGLDVGQSVRTIKECVREAKSDLTVITNLMEARLIDGPDHLFTAMRTACGPKKIWPSARFFKAKRKEQLRRYFKYDDTAYRLEPNIKEGPGGLRDIQTVAWVAKRHFLAHDLNELVKHNFLTDYEYKTLIEGQEHLWRIRFALHLLTGRKEDRLLFDYQCKLAEYFGYVDNETNLAVEQFMQKYYRVVMELQVLNDILLQHFEETILLRRKLGRPKKINNRFQSRKQYIEINDPAIFEKNPIALLELFHLIQMNDKLAGIRAETIRHIRNNLWRIDNEFRNDTRARSFFIEILKQPKGVTKVIRLMSRYGVLGAYIPAFEYITGRMQYDLFHAYTVDQHTLFVIRNMRRLMLKQFENELPMVSHVARNLPKPELAYLSALFHDIAKGRGGDHSELGAEDAETFCLQHGLSKYDARLVAWLVRQHLLMSQTSQRRDTSDPQVIFEFANTVGDINHLSYLYVLTVSDMRATNPDLWTTWKSSLLADLYNATRNTLRRGLGKAIDKETLITEIRNNAIDLLSKDKISPEQISNVFDNYGEDYFLRHTAEEVAWHSKTILNSVGKELPILAIRNDEKRGGTIIFLFDHDKPNLFALVTAELDRQNLSVQDARILVSDQNHALDTFVVLDHNGKMIKDHTHQKSIIDILHERLADNRPDVYSVSRHLPRQHLHFSYPTTVNFSDDSTNNRTIMELTTSDRPGLLSRVGQVFMELDIRVDGARITTIGTRADDVFFLSNAKGDPLDPSLQDDLQARLKNQLDLEDAA